MLQVRWVGSQGVWGSQNTQAYRHLMSMKKTVREPSRSISVVSNESHTRKMIIFENEIIPSTWNLINYCLTNTNCNHIYSNDLQLTLSTIQHNTEYLHTSPLSLAGLKMGMSEEPRSANKRIIIHYLRII